MKVNGSIEKLWTKVLGILNTKIVARKIQRKLPTIKNYNYFPDNLSDIDDSY